MICRSCSTAVRSTRRHRADSAEPKLCLHRHRRAADPLAQPRLFGADQTLSADRSRRSAFSRRARSRSVQSLAGGADAGDVASDRECRGAAQAARRRARTMVLTAALERDSGRRQARAGLHRADADAAERSRYRARDRPRRRSRRDLRRAPALARGHRRAARRGAGEHLPADDHAAVPIGPMPPAPAGARSRTSAST